MTDDRGGREGGGQDDDCSECCMKRSLLPPDFTRSRIFLGTRIIKSDLRLCVIASRFSITLLSDLEEEKTRDAELRVAFSRSGSYCPLLFVCVLNIRTDRIVIESIECE